MSHTYFSLPDNKLNRSYRTSKFNYSHQLRILKRKRLNLARDEDQYFKVNFS